MNGRESDGRPGKHDRNEMGQIKGRRHSIRLRNFDYTQQGAYFLTICTHERKSLFGRIINGEMRLNTYGRIVEEEWEKTAQIRSNLTMDRFIVMPNHIHGIVVISRGTMHRAPTSTFESFGKLVSNSIPTIVRGFKSAVTTRINAIRNSSHKPVWQRNYYEHVIRNEIDLKEIYEYINSNPLKWLEDENNPVNLKRQQK